LEQILKSVKVTHNHHICKYL